MCFICGRGNCTPMFHSPEEQTAFEPASEAYDNYLEVRAKCETDYAEAGAEEEEEPEDQP